MRPPQAANGNIELCHLGLLKYVLLLLTTVSISRTLQNIPEYGYNIREECSNTNSESRKTPRNRAFDQRRRWFIEEIKTQ